jgi:hypothetical protein
MIVLNLNKKITLADHVREKLSGFGISAISGRVESPGDWENAAEQVCRVVDPTGSDRKPD